MSIPPKEICRFNTIPIKLSRPFLNINRKSSPKVCMELKKNTHTHSQDNILTPWKIYQCNLKQSKMLIHSTSQSKYWKTTNEPLIDYLICLRFNQLIEINWYRGLYNLYSYLWLMLLFLMFCNKTEQIFVFCTLKAVVLKFPIKNLAKA